MRPKAKDRRVMSNTGEATAELVRAGYWCAIRVRSGERRNAASRARAKVRSCCANCRHRMLIHAFLSASVRL